MKNMSKYSYIMLLVILLLASFVKGQSVQMKDLSSSNMNSQFNKEELVKAKKHLDELLKQNTGSIKLIIGNEDYSSVYNLGFPKEILVLDDRIEFIFKNDKNIITQTIKLFFIYILENKIKTTAVDSNSDDGRLISESHIRLGNISVVMKSEYSHVTKSLVKDLKIIQDKLNEERFKMDEFKQIVVDEQVLKEKPSISEEQRKHIIQANALTQIMLYDQAIEHYNKVIELNQTSYPSAYFNLALLSAQIKKYYAAIDYMKKYLLLNTEISDVQNANYKINDWEIILQN